MEEEIEDALSVLQRGGTHFVENMMKGFSLYPESHYYQVCRHEIVLVDRKAWEEVDRIIKEASLEMCLTSKYEYVRECKKWYEANSEE
jgi:hypothetical protein